MLEDRGLSAAGEAAECSRLVELVERRYVTAVSGVSAFYHEPGKAVYRLDRGGGRSWVVRWFPRRVSPRRLAHEAGVLRLLEDERIPAERLICAADGSPAVSLEGRGVLVTRFVPGAAPRLTPPVARWLGGVLGRLSVLPAGPSEGSVPRRAASLPREDLASGRGWLAGVAGLVPASRRAECDRLEAALAATGTGEDLPSGLVHTDCQPANVLRTPGGRLVLIDWEGTGHGPAVAALGVLLYHCARGPAAADPVAPVSGVVKAVMDGYLAHRQLSRAELAYLEDAIRFRPLAVAARETAASIRRGDAAGPAGWWSAWTQADTIAARARQAAARPGS